MMQEMSQPHPYYAHHQHGGYYGGSGYAMSEPGVLGQYGYGGTPPGAQNFYGYQSMPTTPTVPVKLEEPWGESSISSVCATSFYDADLLTSTSASATTTAQQLTPPLTVSSTATTDAEEGSQLMCRVCGDLASGYHYGVPSCEGCKGFYRRTVHLQVVYECARQGQCPVTKMTRNRCQRCRFDKCLAMGMRRNLGRMPHDQLRKRLRHMKKAQQQPRQIEPARNNTNSEEIKRYVELSTGVLNAYVRAWPANRGPASLGELRDWAKKFLRGIGELFDLTEAERDELVERRLRGFLVSCALANYGNCHLQIVRAVHQNQPHLLSLLSLDYNRCGSYLNLDYAGLQSYESYIRSMPRNAPMYELIHVISGILLTTPTPEMEQFMEPPRFLRLRAFNQQLGALLYRQLAETGIQLTSVEFMTFINELLALR